MGTLATHVDMFPSCLVECAMHRQWSGRFILPHLFYDRLASNTSALKKLVLDISFSHKLYQTKSNDLAGSN